MKDYKMLNLLGIDMALKSILDRYDSVDKLCDGIGGFSMDYEYLGSKFTGFCDYNKKGIEIRINSSSMIRDERGTWIGWGIEGAKNGICYRISYTKSELNKLILTKGQQTLF